MEMKVWILMYHRTELQNISINLKVTWDFTSLYIYTKLQRRVTSTILIGTVHVYQSDNIGHTGTWSCRQFSTNLILWLQLDTHSWLFHVQFICLNIAPKMKVLLYFFFFPKLEPQVINLCWCYNSMLLLDLGHWSQRLVDIEKKAGRRGSQMSHNFDDPKYVMTKTYQDRRSLQTNLCWHWSKHWAMHNTRQKQSLVKCFQAFSFMPFNNSLPYVHEFMFNVLTGMYMSST